MFNVWSGLALLLLLFLWLTPLFPLRASRESPQIQEKKKSTIWQLWDSAFIKLIYNKSKLFGENIQIKNLSFSFSLHPPASPVSSAHRPALRPSSGHTTASTSTTSRPRRLVSLSDAATPCVRSPPPTARWSSSLKSEQQQPATNLHLTLKPPSLSASHSALVWTPGCLLALWQLGE